MPAAARLLLPPKTEVFCHLRNVMLLLANIRGQCADHKIVSEWIYLQGCKINVRLYWLHCQIKMILLTKLNRTQNDQMARAWKGGGGRFKVSVDDDAPLPRGIACATRGIGATLNAGLMMDSRPLWDPTTIQRLPSLHRKLLRHCFQRRFNSVLHL